MLQQLPLNANAEALQQHLKLLTEAYKRTLALADGLQVILCMCGWWPCIILILMTVHHMHDMGEQQETATASHLHVSDDGVLGTQTQRPS